jgi:hypothetical protein
MQCIYSLTQPLSTTLEFRHHEPSRPETNDMIIFYKPSDEGRSVWSGECVDALGVGSWSMGIELGA